MSKNNRNYNKNNNRNNYEVARTNNNNYVANRSYNNYNNNSNRNGLDFHYNGINVNIDIDRVVNNLKKRGKEIIVDNIIDDIDD